MKPTLQPMKTSSPGGIFSIDFSSLTKLKEIYMHITGKFVAVPSGNPCNFFTDWSGFSVGHEGAVSEGDFMSLSSFGILHRLNQMAKGGMDEANTGVAGTAFQAHLKIPFDYEEFLFGSSHQNVIPMASTDKFRFRLPTYGGTAAATDLEDLSIEVGVRHGDGSFRYFPVLTDDSESTSAGQFEGIPNDLLMLLVPKPAAGSTTLRVGVKEGTNNVLDSTLWSVLKSSTASEYNITEASEWDLAAIRFWNGQNLSGALGKNLQIALQSGSGTVFWGALQQRHSDYFNKLSQSTNAIVDNQQMTRLSAEGVSFDQMKAAIPSLAVQEAINPQGRRQLSKAINQNRKIARRTRKSLLGAILKGRR